ncbi:hypothetical protein CBOM_07700 [Ceraceosorus bombacis]|uniref:Uncharacterized protein n=1 Tax=Ceraceosorus bombacis TaxID=401625 RepID=A0A0P1BI00_9BASI|nr:hypothetical protein CBOM_07700 [Ceraceosorus bombacis]
MRKYRVQREVRDTAWLCQHLALGQSSTGKHKATEISGAKLRSCTGLRRSTSPTKPHNLHAPHCELLMSVRSAGGLCATDWQGTETFHKAASSGTGWNWLRLLQCFRRGRDDRQPFRKHERRLMPAAHWLTALYHLSAVHSAAEPLCICA